jgi:hypothetical protein
MVTRAEIIAAISLLAIAPGSEVRVIVLYSEDAESIENAPDDTPIEDVKASLRRALQEAKTGSRIPLAEMWVGLDG